MSSPLPLSPTADFPAIITRLRKNPDGAKRVEQLVLRLLSRLALDENKTLEVNEGSGFDAIAPAGIRELAGPTIIDVTHRLLRAQSTGYWQYLQKLVSAHDANSALLITTAAPPAERLSRVLEMGAQRIGGIALRVWGPADLAPLIDKYPDAIGDLVPEVGTRAIAAVIAAAEDDWMLKREAGVRELERAYFADKLSIFIGAGASADCGLPDWKRLISGIAVSMVQEESEKQPDLASRKMNDSEQRTIAEAMVNPQMASPLLVARYLEYSLKEQFATTLSRVLYRDIKPAKSALIMAIAELCRPTRRREGVVAVVSYNFDDLLEEALRQLGIRNQSVHEEGKIPDPDDLPVYHVHGMLERPLATADRSATDDTPTMKTLIFSEDSYLSLQADHYSWANFEQLKLLRETTCLLIGLSGTDPNLRRLLSIDERQSKKAKHFIFLKRQTVTDLLGDPSRVRSEVAQHFLNVHHNLQEVSFRGLGLNVIWVQRHEDIPGVLKQIANGRTAV